ncbi:MAG: transcriptional regulator PpsR [Pseudomonadota bacterium]
MTTSRSTGDGTPATQARTARALVATACDLALTVDSEDRVVDVEASLDAFAEATAEGWLNRPVADIVTDESKAKIGALLAEARGDGRGRWREINHPAPDGEDLPIRYASAYAPDEDVVILMGRDMRAVASLQSRLVSAQQAMEQEYERLRQMETRYRILFQTASEAFLVVEAGSEKIVEANPSAARLLGKEPQGLAGRPLQEQFAPAGRPALAGALAAALASGRSETATLTNAAETRMLEVRATLFRAASETLILCTLRPRDGDLDQDGETERSVMRLMRRMTDGFVLTDEDGGILWANDAFLGLAEVALEDQLKGESLGRFLGRPGVDLNVMLSNAQEHGRLRQFSTQLRGAYGSTAQVEISTAHLPGEPKPGFGFVIRDVSRAGSGAEGASRRGAAAEPQSIDHMVELVGSVPLRELVRATTDEIERMCIQTALRLTGGNRASAAEMLGLSRQSLYVKLRRFGLVDGGDDD